MNTLLPTDEYGHPSRRPIPAFISTTAERSQLYALLETWPAPLVLVCDSYGRTAPDVHSSLALVLEQMPQHVQLVLLMTHEPSVPPLPLPQREAHASRPRPHLPTPDPDDTIMIEQLSPREQEVLLLIAQGASNSTIAAMLHLSVHTIKRHTSSILTKLNATNRTQAVAYARAYGVLAAEGAFGYA